MLAFVFMVLLLFTAVALILLVLVQRGKGGGLAGAFGGLGGQSAFGTKAGDTFTRITIVVATFWIVLCVLSVRMLTLPAAAQRRAADKAPAEQPAEGPAQGDDATDSAPSSDAE